MGILICNIFIFRHIVCNSMPIQTLELLFEGFFSSKFILMRKRQISKKIFPFLAQYHYDTIKLGTIFFEISVYNASVGKMRKGGSYGL